jgi:hypothetical protein
MAARANAQLKHWAYQGVIQKPKLLALEEVSVSGYAAYALRKLRPAYTGAAIRVRRSSDNAEQDIGFIGETLDTVALSAFIGLNSGYVKIWYDQSGNGRDLIQATTANQLRIVNAGEIDAYNGIPALRILTGSPHSLFATLSLSQPYNYSVVARRHSDIGGSVQVLSGGDAYTASFACKPTTGTFQINAGANLDSSTVMPQIPFAALSVYDSTNSKIFKDGVEIASGDAGTGGISSPFEFGAWAGGQEGGDFSGFEAILFDQNLSAADRAALQRNQIAYYKIHNSTFYDTWGQHWFKRIASNATYTPFQVTSAVGSDSEPGFSSLYFGVDVNYRFEVDNSDPIVALKVPGSWSDRDSGTIWQMDIRLPADVIVPDASEGNTPNNPTIIYNRDTCGHVAVNAFARTTEGGDAFGYHNSTTEMSHNGSGTRGGEILLEELNAGYIPHYLGINVWGKKYLSSAGSGYVAPAIKADSNYNNSGSNEYYGGNVPALVMGSRLGIPPNVSAASLGVVSAVGLTIYRALVEFGAIIVDNTIDDNIAINADTGAGALITAQATEMRALMKALRLIS